MMNIVMDIRRLPVLFRQRLFYEGYGKFEPNIYD